MDEGQTQPDSERPPNDTIALGLCISCNSGSTTCRTCDFSHGARLDGALEDRTSDLKSHQKDILTDLSCHLEKLHCGVTSRNSVINGCTTPFLKCTNHPKPDYATLNGVTKCAHDGPHRPAFAARRTPDDEESCAESRTPAVRVRAGSQESLQEVDDEGPDDDVRSREAESLREAEAGCSAVDKLSARTQLLALRQEETSVAYVGYESESQMPDIMRLIQKDLSEPYSIYTYRYFIHNWPKLCFLAMHEDECIGAIVCKLDLHKKLIKRGYIAMLAVDENYRKRKIGSNLVLKAIHAMMADDADEVVLETEITNRPALKLYENLGFVRDKRLFRYYLNGVDALRLKLWLR